MAWHGWELRCFSLWSDIHTTSDLYRRYSGHILALAFHREKLQCLYGEGLLIGERVGNSSQVSWKIATNSDGESYSHAFLFQFSDPVQ
jgi:hypothetical protein